MKYKIFVNTADRDDKVQTYKGYSWGCLLFGSLWFLHKGMMKWFILYAILFMLTCGVIMLFIPQMAHKMHRDFLIKRGFVEMGALK